MDYIEKAEKAFMNTYKRYPIVFEKGEGVYLYDTTGKKYLDFAAGIAVNILGYSCNEYKEALKSQIDSIIHCSNLFYNKPAIEAAEILVQKTGMHKAFLANSGTEAIEGAVKLARKYGYKKGIKNTEVIAMNNSFHGRSLGALAVTGQPKYQEIYKSVISGVQFANYNDYKSVEALVNENTCAIILEPIQGEGGIYPATKEFMQNLRKLCDLNDILLIFDEIQCGIGRTGKLFAFENYDVKPDVIVLAKGIGAGIPVGAFVSNEKAAVFEPGDHGTTYGGNPLAGTAVKITFDLLDKYSIINNAEVMGNYLSEKLNELFKTSECIFDIRGKGLMQGIEFNCEVVPIIRNCMEKGLLVINAGAKVIRLVPPLIINKDNIDEMIDVLKSSF
jgi:acetylornithine/N-succinyldiaminopimelate aminotransferase